jgi:multiple antibiotic resistance protein
VPLFVAVDAFSLLPVFLGLTEGMEAGQVQRVIIQSVVTATIVALAFLFVGTAILRLLGITVADFMVAGGVLLFAISMTDLLTAEEKRRRQVDAESLGAVPLGVPLLTGPAVLTTSVLLLNAYGVLPTATALIANLLLAGVLFRFARVINRLLGRAGAKTLSKIASLLLAAIAVSIVRKGVFSLIGEGTQP